MCMKNKKRKKGKNKSWKDESKKKQLRVQMTREEKIELCRLYNKSDIEALVYMKNFI